MWARTFGREDVSSTEIDSSNQENDWSLASRWRNDLFRVEGLYVDVGEDFKKGEVLNIPVAHADGNYYIDEAGLIELNKNNQILLRYCDKDGNPMVLNGSIEQIAGVCNKQKNVFGLMPHPERAIELALGSEDGIKMLEGFKD
jgi:phosphoribosylformylglycinamidine (FGAM) synthase-like amidotransferase family enzyme